MEPLLCFTAVCENGELTLGRYRLIDSLEVKYLFFFTSAKMAVVIKLHS